MKKNEIEVEKRTLESANINIGDSQYELKKDFYTYPNFSQKTIKSNDILFLGYGIDSKNYSDYTTNVEGRVIMVFNGEPKDEEGNYLVSGGKEKRVHTVRCGKAGHSGAVYGGQCDANAP